MEDIPKAEAKIATKRVNRLSRKIDEARSGVFTRPGWWSNKLVESLALFLILGLNFYLLAPFLGRENLGTQFSSPVIPLLATLLSVVFPLSVAAAVELTIIVFLALLPVSLYLLIDFLTHRKLTALIAALLATLPISILAQTRVVGALWGGDGAHIASLGLVPLAVYGLIAFLRTGGLRNFLIATLINAAILLISPFGFLTYLIFALVAVFSEMLLGYGRLKLLRFWLAICLSLALVSFWYNPAFVLWLASGPLGRDVRTVLGQLIPVSLVALPILGTVGFLLFDRRPDLQPVFLALFWIVAFVLIVSVRNGSFLASNSSRCWPEVGVALSFALAMLITGGIDRAKVTWGFRYRRLSGPGLSNPLVFATLLLLVVVALLGRPELVSASRGSSEGDVAGSRTQMWKGRDQSGSFSTLVGVSITLATVGGLVVFLTRAKKWEKS